MSDAAPVQGQYIASVFVLPLIRGQCQVSSSRGGAWLVRDCEPDPLPPWWMHKARLNLETLWNHGAAVALRVRDNAHSVRE